MPGDVHMIPFFLRFIAGMQWAWYTPFDGIHVDAKSLGPVGMMRLTILSEKKNDNQIIMILYSPSMNDIYKYLIYNSV